MPTPFQEDFFERVVDVKWESEPDVYWMAGSGCCLFVDGLGTPGGYLFTSDDGLSWDAGQDLFKSWPEQGMGGIHTGCWMRMGLQKGAPPVWVLSGVNSTPGVISAATSSMDGKTLSPITLFDMRHAAEKISKSTTIVTGTDPVSGEEIKIEVGCIKIASRFLVPPGTHKDPFTSTDGITWEPGHYHRFDDSGNLELPTQQSLGALGASAVPMQAGSGSILRTFSIMLVQSAGAPTPMPLSAGVPSLMMSEAAQIKADKKTFKSSGISAVGKLRKGRFADKVVKITIEPYHILPNGGDHGDTTVTITDNKTGEKLAIADTGVARSITIGYGHYVFVIGGSSTLDILGTDGPQESTIACTEDGVTWRTIELGAHHQVNAIVVGPRS
jgi:hypothetical protein